MIIFVLAALRIYASKVLIETHQNYAQIENKKEIGLGVSGFMNTLMSRNHSRLKQTIKPLVCS